MATAPYNYSYIFKYIIIGKWAALKPSLPAWHWQGSELQTSPHLFLSLFFVGDMGVGKSCLLHQFTEKKCKCNLDFNASASQLAHACLWLRLLGSTRVFHIPTEVSCREAWNRQHESAAAPPPHHSAPFLFSSTINKADTVCLIHSKPHHILHTHPR